MPETPPAAPKPPRKWRRRVRRAALALGVGGVLFLGASCVHLHRDNPAYGATTGEVRDAMDAMRDDPVGLERPVLILSGYRSPGGTGAKLAGEIERLTGAPDDRVASVSYMFASDIEPLGDTVVAFVDERWPTDDPERTTEVDVVAISMGGLVARWAAMDRGEGSRRLRINTLYTLATPHRGAKLADTIRLDEASRQMRPGSEFLARLDGAFADRDYEVVPYAVLRDTWVGATNAAPEGMDPVWVPGRLVLSHHLVSLEPRIVGDIAARLRSEDALGGAGAPPRD